MSDGSTIFEFMGRFHKPIFERMPERMPELSPGFNWMDWAMEQGIVTRGELEEAIEYEFAITMHFAWLDGRRAYLREFAQ